MRLAIMLATGLAVAAAMPRATSSGESPARDSGRNVILVTLDGVRREELLGAVDPALAPGDDRPLFEYLHGELGGRGRLYGDPSFGEAMTVANPVFVSLPAYQSIYTGSTQGCLDNDCARVSERTLSERIVAELGLERDKVATFASWKKIARAAEHHAGATLVNTGLAPLSDDTDDEELREINEAQAANLPEWPDARLDEYTHLHALRHLRLHQPRFMHIAFNDSDEWAHKGDYPRYLESLRRYDTWLRELVDTLATLGDYGRETCLIVTTDHGRGQGEKWTRHSNGELHAGAVAMWAGCPLSAAPPSLVAGRALTTHLDIRPTIEALLGLEPRDCLACGRSLVAP